MVLTLHYGIDASLNLPPMELSKFSDSGGWLNE